MVQGQPIEGLVFQMLGALWAAGRLRRLAAVIISVPIGTGAQRTA